MGPSDPLPAIHFSTEGLPKPAQFEAWREAVGVTHEMTGIGDLDRTGITASSDVWRLGRLVASIRTFPELDFDRSSQRARIDGLDHYSVLLMLNGCWEGDVDGQEVRLEPGQACLFDLARPVANRVTQNRSLRVMVPRELLDHALPGRRADLHGHVLAGGPGSLMSDYLGLLARDIGTLTVGQAPMIGGAARHMIAAGLAGSLGQPTAELIHAARGAIAETRFARVRHYIEIWLTDPGLDAEMICRDLGLSRSALYRLFEARGGVMAYIQYRRLARARDVLLDPSNHERITDLAWRHGFVSDTHFSRAFRAAFGASPREVRGSGTTAGLKAAGQSSNPYLDWVRQA